MTQNIMSEEYNSFLSDLKERVTSARYKAALSVNRKLILLYHHIGTQILEAQKHQGWGARVIDQLSKDLRSEFPEMKGFSTRNLKYMRKFAEEYPDVEFVQEVLAQLTWYHNVTLLDKISDKQIRLFYVKHAIQHGWSRNIMVMQIESVQIANKYRGQKIGTWMFDREISYAKKYDVSITQLTTNKKRPKEKHFYEKLGFEVSHEGMKLHLRKE